VGVKQYRHADLPDLKYTERDVEELATLLEAGSAFTSVRLLTTSRGKTRPAQAPTADNVRRALEELLRGTSKHDLVLVALAGHGLQARVEGKDQAFFCPSDAQPGRPETLIGLHGLFRQLEESGAGVKLLLVDACRNDPRSGRSLDADSVPRPPQGIAALFSCSAGQRAFESSRLGGGHGLFFHFVLEGLRGKASRENEVTWDDLSAYVKRRVPRAVTEVIGDGARQSPHLVANLTGEPAVLLRLPGGKPRAGA
jgi:uncharacterized caspase-like protein